MTDLIAIKDYIVEKIRDVAETVDLQDKVSACKKKLASARRELKRAAASLKEKKISDCIACVVPRQEKKANPVVAVFCVLGGVMLAFALLVAMFYGIFYLLDNKKKNGYHTIKF